MCYLDETMNEKILKTNKSFYRNVTSFKLILIFILVSNTFSPGWAQNRTWRATGLIPATEEQLRGIPMASVPFAGDSLPPAVDLSANLPPPGNQGRQNSCVGWTVAYALKSYQEKIEEGVSFFDSSGKINPRRVFSPAFIYNQINNGRDGGSSFISALNLLSSQGAATWADMPYSENDYLSKPSRTTISRAKPYRIDYWRRVNVRDVKEVKAQLNAGYPVMAGVKTDEGFNNAGRGFIWQSTMGQVRGAHAILLVGYNDSRRAFKLINSYGALWGDSGYGWVEYTHFTRVASEGYVAKDAINPRRRTDVSPPSPSPRRTIYTKPTFTITNIQHNTYYTNRPDLGYFMRFDGKLSIPPGLGRQNQVVIYFYYDTGGGMPGRQLYSLNTHYADINGFAACGTASYPIPSPGLSTTWTAWIPYSALNLRVGTYRQTYSGPVYEPYTSYLVAEPVLFIDNFGVKRGSLVKFTVTK
jgi:hypothetical protein